MDLQNYILVEEEELIRKEWSKIASEKSLPLFIYATPVDVLADFYIDQFSARDRFFFDQDFGGIRGVGVRLARIIKEKWPVAYTCLITAYPKSLFHKELNEGIIDEVFGKYPYPFENQRYTEYEHQFEKAVWEPYLAEAGLLK